MLATRETVKEASASASAWPDELVGAAVMADAPCLAACEWPAGDEQAHQYYRARYYDPRTGRFVSEDPAGIDSGGDPYVYAFDNPPRLSDPFGLKPGDRRYKSRDEAVLKAYEWLRDQKFDARYEFGGEVCETTAHCFFVTGPVPGTRGSVDVHSAPCPGGTTYAGYYHTHLPGWWNMNFSPDDVYNYRPPTQTDPEYYVTPKTPAYVWFTDPGDRRVFENDGPGAKPRYVGTVR